MSEDKKNILTGIRVLVLDDEPAVRDLEERFLTRAGAEVQAASDGRQGLQVLVDSYFDILVVDLRMPRMDGVTFLQEALRIWPWLGVVVVTGYAHPDKIREVNELGVTCLLEKPFDGRRLVREVADEYQRRQNGVFMKQTIPLFKVQQQLQILRLITEPALESGTLLDALRRLSIDLSKSLDFAVVGVFACEKDENAVIFHVNDEINPKFIDQVRESFKQRYNALTGKDVPADLRVEMSGREPVGYDAREVRTSFCVPIMTGGDIRGFLILASPDASRLNASEVSFIYHVSNHLSTVFTTLSRMRSLAIHDPMTGLYNRLHLEAEIRDVWSWCERYKRPLTVVVIDLDHFKMVNDTHGHVVGDRVLKEFAGVLDKSSRASDIVGRYGGEEFIVILPNTDSDDALIYANRLLEKVRQHLFVEGEYDLLLTLSMGIASATSEVMAESTPEAVVEQADKAMYMAKRAGRNCVRLWSDRSEGGRIDAVDLEEAPAAQVEDARTKSVNGEIMVIDDDDDIRKLMSALLEREGYGTAGFADGEAALAALAANSGRYDLALIDIKLPGMDGIEMLKRVRSYDDTIVCIMISGYATVDNAISSMRRGAFDYIQKPCVRDQVLLSIGRAMEYRRALVENRQYQQHLSKMVKTKSAHAREALGEVRSSYQFTLEALVDLLDAREKDTGDHSKRVRAMALRLGREMNMSDAQLEDLSYGALLHDIGKIGIPDRILLKPGKLTDEEMQIMKKHAEIGYHVLAGSSYLTNAAEIVYSHQESYDGGGYPRGLKGEDICLGARLFTVIDAYDAMRAKRVYRDPLPEPKALDEIKRMTGRQFDPQVVEAFLQCYDDIAEIYDSWHNIDEKERSKILHFMQELPV